MNQRTFCIRRLSALRESELGGDELLHVRTAVQPKREPIRYYEEVGLLATVAATVTEGVTASARLNRALRRCPEHWCATHLLWRSSTSCEDPASPWQMHRDADRHGGHL